MFTNACNVRPKGGMGNSLIGTSGRIPSSHRPFAASEHQPLDRLITPPPAAPAAPTKAVIFEITQLGRLSLSLVERILNLGIISHQSLPRHTRQGFSPATACPLSSSLKTRGFCIATDPSHTHNVCSSVVALPPRSLCSPPGPEHPGFLDPKQPPR